MLTSCPCTGNKSSLADQLTPSILWFACIVRWQMPLSVSLMLPVYGHTVALTLEIDIQPVCLIRP